jgi:hypothetical protein
MQWLEVAVVVGGGLGSDGVGSDKEDLNVVWCGRLGGEEGEEAKVKGRGERRGVFTGIGGNTDKAEANGGAWRGK